MLYYDVLDMAKDFDGSLYSNMHTTTFIHSTGLPSEGSMLFGY